jgi:hypothetical protein
MLVHHAYQFIVVRKSVGKKVFAITKISLVGMRKSRPSIGFSKPDF